jgi:hypothetical protein
MRRKIWAFSAAAIVGLSVATSASATVVTTSLKFKPDKVVGATIDANNFELMLSVVNPSVVESYSGVFQQDVKQAGLGNGTRFTWAQGAMGNPVGNGGTTTLGVKFDKIFKGAAVTIKATDAHWTENNKPLNTVPFPGFQEVQVRPVGTDPLTELDLLNDGTDTLIVTDFSWALSNVEIPLVTLDFNPFGLANFVGTLSIPSGGSTVVFQNVDIHDDQFLVFQGRLSDTSTFAFEQNIRVPEPSSGWLFVLGFLLLVGLAICKRTLRSVRISGFLRIDQQSQDRQSPRPDDPAVAATAGG